jgi:O-antigen ligase
LSAVIIYLNDKSEKIVRWLFIVATMVSLYAIVQTFTGLILFRSGEYGTTDVAGYKIWRAKGFFGNTMDYSYVMGSVFCVAFATLLVRFYRGRDAWHMLVTTFVIGLSLLLTFTRGAWVATVLAMCVVMFLHNKKWGALFVGFVIVLSGLGIQFNPVIRDRFYSLFGTGDAAVSLSHRKDLFKANWAMFKDHPFLGVGYGQNSKFVQEYHMKLKGSEGFVGNAHNNILQMLAGVGVFGFAFWVLICGYFMWLAFSLWRGARGQNNFVEAFSLGAIGAQVFFHIGGLTQATFFDSEPLNMMLFIWAVLVAHRYKVMSGPSVFYNLRSKQVG